MWNVVQTFIGDVLNSLVGEYMTAFQEVVGNLFRSSFMIETLPGLDSSILSTSIVQSLLAALYGFMVLLLTLKLLWKGFKTYILWRDGESENPPGEMVVGAVFAIIVAIAFPYLYEIAVEVVIEIARTLLNLIGFRVYEGNDSWFDFLINLFRNAQDLGQMLILLSVVYIILLLILICKLIMQSAELLVWRLGVPFAVIGLVDSDGGVWKPYLQIIFKVLVTNLVQYFLVILGTYLIADLQFVNLCIGIVLEITAFCVPKLLSQFMVSRGGGGLSQKIHTVAMVARTFAGG